MRGFDKKIFGRYRTKTFTEISNLCILLSFQWDFDRAFETVSEHLINRLPGAMERVAGNASRVTCARLVG